MTVALKRAETKLTAYGPCIKKIIKTLRCNDSTATRTSLSLYIAIIPTYLLCKTVANLPEIEFQKTIFKFRKRNKISFCLSTFSIKREINQILVVVVQKRQRNVCITVFVLRIPAIFTTITLSFSEQTVHRGDKRTT